MGYLDIAFLIFLVVFVLIFFRLGIVTAVESFLSFALSFFLSSILLNPIISLLFRLGWRENVQTPLAIYPLLLILFWGIIFAIISVLYNPPKTALSKILSVPVLLIYAIFLAFAVSIFLPQYLEVFGLKDRIGSSLFFSAFDNKEFVKSFRTRYLGSLNPNLIESVVVSKEDNEIILLKFEIKEATSTSSSAAETFDLINKSRQTASLPAYSRDKNLDVLAQNYAETIAQTKYFGHIDKDNNLPSSRAKKAGIKFDYLGENLVLAPNISLAHQVLMESQSHRENILSPVFKRVGIGAVDIGRNGKIIVEEFSN